MEKKSQWYSVFLNLKFLFGLYVLLTIAASIQSLVRVKTYDSIKIEYTAYNNYKIFEKSFDHLKQGQDLYVSYPKEHWDLYKYTPSFSVFFGIFAFMPDWLGLSFWNLLNALILFFAIYYLPKLTLKEKGLGLLIIIPELMTSIQNEQSNGLIAGLLILTFVMLEKDKLFIAAFLIVFSVFIKLFGLVGLAMFIFYPKKLKSVLYIAFWTVIFLILPLIYIDLNQYCQLGTSYLDLLSNDHTASYGYSLMGIINTWFSVEVHKPLIVLSGAFLLVLPLIRLKAFSLTQFRQFFISSILIWIVIFNHKAESPTFIIAMAGVIIWFFNTQKNKLQVALLLLAIVLTSLSVTDLFPRIVRNEFIKPYALKALPCVIIWFMVVYQMLFQKFKPLELES